MNRMFYFVAGVFVATGSSSFTVKSAEAVPITHIELLTGQRGAVSIAEGVRVDNEGNVIGGGGYLIKFGEVDTGSKKAKKAAKKKLRFDYSPAIFGFAISTNNAATAMPHVDRFGWQAAYLTAADWEAGAGAFESLGFAPRDLGSFGDLFESDDFAVYLYYLDSAEEKALDEARYERALRELELLDAQSAALAAAHDLTIAELRLSDARQVLADAENHLLAMRADLDAAIAADAPAETIAQLEADVAEAEAAADVARTEYHEAHDEAVQRKYEDAIARIREAEAITALDNAIVNADKALLKASLVDIDDDIRPITEGDDDNFWLDPNQIFESSFFFDDGTVFSEYFVFGSEGTLFDGSSSLFANAVPEPQGLAGGCLAVLAIVAARRVRRRRSRTA